MSSGSPKIWNDSSRPGITTLDALLGLSPDIVVPLDDKPDLPAIDPDAVRRSLPDLAQHRPDLIALQLGYQAQEESLRGAILGQFPALSFGGNWGSDTTRVRSGGPAITFDLPIFNHNQGAIAIETATRQQLFDEYTARLSATTGEVEALLTEQALAERQLAALVPEATSADAVFQRANVAFEARLLDERSFVDFASARSAKMQQRITLEQTILEQRVALASLIGAGLPAIEIPASQ